jgi:hypothetical protein
LAAVATILSSSTMPTATRSAIPLSFLRISMTFSAGSALVRKEVYVSSREYHELGVVRITFSPWLMAPRERSYFLLVDAEDGRFIVLEV